MPTEQEGVLYLAVILDGFSRRVVGWSMQAYLHTDLVLAALELALWSRRPADGLIHRSNHGCQYTSLRFGQRCAAAGIRPSIGTVDDCYDNAMMESFFATLECELLATHRFPTHAAAHVAVFEWIEVFYNRQRRHSALGYVAPAAYERTVTPLRQASLEANSPRNQGHFTEGTPVDLGVRDGMPELLEVRQERGVLPGTAARRREQEHPGKSRAAHLNP